MSESRNRAATRCPICRQPLEEAARYRPFCSKRCSDVDLGRWLTGRYAIPGEPAGSGDSEEN